MASLTDAFNADMAKLDQDYLDALADSQTQYENAMTGPRRAYQQAVDRANTAYDNAVQGYAQTRADAERQANQAYQQAVEQAEENYWNAVDAHESSCGGWFESDCDPSHLAPYAKQYQLAVAAAEIPLAEALGTAAVDYVTAERAADTTREQAINQAEHDRNVADARATYDRTIRDLNAREQYLKAAADRRAQYDKDLTAEQKEYDEAVLPAEWNLVLDLQAAEEAYALAVNQAERDRAHAEAAAWEAYANAWRKLEEQREIAYAEAAETLDNDLAAAEAALWNAEAQAGYSYALAVAEADADLQRDLAAEQEALVQAVATALVTWTSHVVNARTAAFVDQNPNHPAAPTVAGAWAQYQNAVAATTAQAMIDEAAHWRTYSNAVAAAERARREAIAAAERDRVRQMAADYQDFVQKTAEAERMATVATVQQTTVATVARNAAERSYAEDQADAWQDYADAVARAARAADDAAADAVYSFLLATLPHELTAAQQTIDAQADAYKTLVAETFAALRDAAAADRDYAIQAAAAWLTAANQKAGLDDAVAVAAAEKDKADAVAAAVQNLADLQAQPVEAFEEAGPESWWSETWESLAETWDSVTEWPDQTRDTATDWISEPTRATARPAEGSQCGAQPHFPPPGGDGTPVRRTGLQACSKCRRNPVVPPRRLEEPPVFTRTCSVCNHARCFEEASSSKRRRSARRPFRLLPEGTDAPLTPWRSVWFGTRERATNTAWRRVVGQHNVVGKTVSEKGGRRTTALVRFRSAAAAILLVVSAPLLGAVAPATHVTQPAWYSILPPLLAIGLALATRRLYTSLLAAILVGGLLAAWQSGLGVVGLVSGLAVAGRALTQSVLDVDQWHVRVDSLLILAYVVFVMTAIAVMAGSGGLQALADRLQRLARSRRSAQVVTFLAGLVVFIDDYANSMIVGSTFRPVADRHGLSRAKLAFIVDATAAPVSGLAFLSTWIGYEVGLLGELAQSLGIDKDGYGIFLDGVVFRFYCLAMLAFVLLIGLTGLDFGPMAREERLAADGLEGRSGAAGQADCAADVEQPSDRFRSSGPRRAAEGQLSCRDDHRSGGLLWVAVGPLLLLVVFFLAGMWVDGGGYRQLSVVEAGVFSFEYWQRVLSQADSIRLLAEASGLCLATSLLLAWQVAGCSAGQLARHAARGLRSAALPVSVLLLAWGLKQTCDELQTGAYLAELLGQRLWPPLFPALVFVVSCVCSFSTGTSWGTMAILLPTALPVAFQLDGSSYGVTSVLTVAAVLDGAIFGDHCSPISDTTIMSAAASGCDQVVHVQTQLPYALVVAGVVLVVGYLPAGLGLSSGVAVTAVWLTVGTLFAGLAVRARWSRSRSGQGPATA